MFLIPNRKHKKYITITVPPVANAEYHFWSVLMTPQSQVTFGFANGLRIGMVQLVI